MRRIGIVFLALYCAGGEIFAAMPDSERPISRAKCVLVIYEEDWGIASSKGPELILALWGDDRIVWSEDAVHGGGPFRTAQLPPGTLDEFVSSLGRAGRFEDRTLRQPWVTWDSRFTTMMTRCNGRELVMRWSPDVGRVDPDATLDAFTTYKHFREVWDELRRRSAKLIAPPGEVTCGRLIADHGTLVWRGRRNR
jgi:hypothetical protein